MAAQLIAVERYSTGEVDSGSTEADVGFIAEVKAAVGVPAATKVDYVKLSDASVTELSYTNDGKTVIYEDYIYTILGAGEGARLPGGYINIGDKNVTLTEEEKVIAIEKMRWRLSTLLI